VPLRPRINRHVGYGVFIAPYPRALAGPIVQHAIQADRLVVVTIPRVLDVVAGVFLGVVVEVVGLAEHRSHVRHLENQPLQGVVALARILGEELAGLLGEVPEDGARFHHGVASAAGTVGVDDGGDAVVGGELQKFRRELLAEADVDVEVLPFDAQLLQHDHDLLAVGGRGRVQFDHGVILPYSFMDGGGCLRGPARSSLAIPLSSPRGRIAKPWQNAAPDP
jgi:hypothetical protein